MVPQPRRQSTRPIVYRSPQNERRRNSNSIDNDSEFLVHYWIRFERPLGTPFHRYCIGKEQYLGVNSGDTKRKRAKSKKEYALRQTPTEQTRLYNESKLVASEAVLALVSFEDSESETAHSPSRRSPACITPPRLPPLSEAQLTEAEEEEEAFYDNWLRQQRSTPTSQPQLAPPFTENTMANRSGAAAAAAAASSGVNNNEFILNFDHPEKNPPGVTCWVKTNWSPDGNGPFCTRVKIDFRQWDPRDHLEDEARLNKAGTALIRTCLAQPTMEVTNTDDLHNEEAERHQAKAAGKRLTQSNGSLKRIDRVYHFPPGVTCRLTPFSVTQEVFKQYSENLTVDFGEIDAEDNAVPYPAYWTSYYLAINEKEQAGKAVNEQERDLSNRFGVYRIDPPRPRPPPVDPPIVDHEMPNAPAPDADEMHVEPETQQPAPVLSSLAAAAAASIPAARTQSPGLFEGGAWIAPEFGLSYEVNEDEDLAEDDEVNEDEDLAEDVKLPPKKWQRTEDDNSSL